MEKLHGQFDYTIVLIDDDKDDQEMFSSSLQDMNHLMTTFSSPKAALQYLQQLPRAEHPSVIVTDYQMPEMNGLELLYTLKDDPSLYHIPVIVYSSAMNIFLDEKLMLFGAAGCFKKSTHLNDLKTFLQVLGIIFENSIFCLHQ